MPFANLSQPNVGKAEFYGEFLGGRAPHALVELLAAHHCDIGSTHIEVRRSGGAGGRARR